MNQRVLEYMDWVNLAVTAIALIASYIVFSIPVTIGLGVGALFMALDFWALRMVVSKLFSENSNTSKPALFMLLMLKFVGFLAGIYLIVKFIPMNMIAFVAGAALIVFTACIASLKNDTKRSQGALNWTTR